MDAVPERTGRVDQRLDAFDRVGASEEQDDRPVVPVMFAERGRRSCRPPLGTRPATFRADFAPSVP
ncbi:MAG: hypothetical protein ACRDYX_16370 [Egibacteraceae bacterium]